MPRKPLKNFSILLDQLMINDSRDKSDQSDDGGYDIWEPPVAVRAISPDNYRKKKRRKPSDQANDGRYCLQKTPVTVTAPFMEKIEIMQSFDNAFSKAILKTINLRKYSRVSPIQQYAIPVIKRRRDVMGCAPTGTGKTIAYLLPVLDYLLKSKLVVNDGRLSPNALVIVPTKKLALQIYKEASLFCKGTKLRAGVACGSAVHGKPADELHITCNFLIATPGRLKELLQQASIDLDKCTTLILDEADRMLNMAFEKDVREIVGNYNLPSKGVRQTLMFSAKFSKREQGLAKDFMHDYVFFEANKDILQEILDVPRSEKLETLKSLVEKYKNDGCRSKCAVKLLVFVRANAAANSLVKHFPNGATINSTMSQQDRKRALKDFETGRISILIATDIASGGLGIPDVDVVINYFLPNTIAVYVQRIGRTGRAGQIGHSISFYDRADKNDNLLRKDLVKCLSDAHQIVPRWLVPETGHTLTLEAFIPKTREDDPRKC